MNANDTPPATLPDLLLAFDEDRRATFAAVVTRPDGVSVESDVQAVVIDGRGQRKRLQFYWITWQ